MAVVANPPWATGTWTEAAWADGTWGLQESALPDLDLDGRYDSQQTLHAAYAPSITLHATAVTTLTVHGENG